MEHVKWVFSGIGVFVLGLIIGLIREAFKNDATFANYRIGYIIPNTLSYFRHGVLIDEEVRLVVRRILSIKMLRSTNINIRFPVYTTGTIDAAVSLSDPGRMNLIKHGEVEAFNSIDINGKRGCQYLVVTESGRTSFPDKRCNVPSQHNRVLISLIDKRIKMERHDFSGTRIVGSTQSVRLIVEFDDSYHPDILHPIQIGKDGAILRDEKSSDFVVAKQNNNTLFILDLHNPEPESGVYLWWEWPPLPKGDAEQSHPADAPKARAADA